MEIGASSAVVPAPTLFSVSSKVVPNRYLTTFVGPIATPTFSVSSVAVGQKVKVYSDSACTTLVTTSDAASSTSVSVTLPTIASYGLVTYYFKAEDPTTGTTSSCSTSGLGYAYARYFLVNDFVDTNRTDSTPGDGTCLNVGGFCSFRAAFDEINAFTTEQYFFLDVASGTHPLSASLNFSPFNKVVAMYGVGTMPVIDGVNTTRHFSSAAVGGAWTQFHVTNLRFTRLRASMGTSAALFSASIVYLHRSEVDSSSSNSDHLFGRTGSLGMGGLYIDQSVIQNNSGAGDLVYTGGPFKAYGSTFSSNAQPIQLRGSNQDYLVENSLFLNNTPFYPLHFWGADGTSNIINSTFTGNSRYAFQLSASTGSVVVNLTNSTLYANAVAGNSEIGINASGGSATVNLSNSIVSVNNGARTNCGFGGGGGTETANVSYSLVDDNSCGTAGTGNLFSISADLSALALNGGTTQNFMPNGTSPVINAGNPNSCPSTDQRGVSRPNGGRCDMGAVESPL